MHPESKERERERVRVNREEEAKRGRRGREIENMRETNVIEPLDGRGRSENETFIA